MKQPPFVARRSSRDGNIAVTAKLTCRNWPNVGSIRMEASADLTIAQARELAAALVALAEKEEAKMAAKEAQGERRRKWREREIAAGRMRVFTPAEFFR